MAGSDFGFLIASARDGFLYFIIHFLLLLLFNVMHMWRVVGIDQSLKLGPIKSGWWMTIRAVFLLVCLLCVCANFWILNQRTCSDWTFTNSRQISCLAAMSMLNHCFRLVIFQLKIPFSISTHAFEWGLHLVASFCLKFISFLFFKARTKDCDWDDCINRKWKDLRCFFLWRMTSAADDVAVVDWRESENKLIPSITFFLSPFFPSSWWMFYCAFNLLKGASLAFISKFKPFFF